MRITTDMVALYVSDVQLAAIFSVSRQTIWRWTAAGHLTQPIKLSPGCTRWRLDQIEQLQGVA
jgi:prophage regulatory protein